MAKNVRNVVSTTIRPDSVRILRNAPCWQTAPQTNVPASKKDREPPNTGCIIWNNNMRNIMNMEIIKQYHTTVSSGKMNILEIVERGGCRKIMAVLQQNGATWIKYYYYPGKCNFLRTWCEKSRRYIPRLVNVPETWMWHATSFWVVSCLIIPWHR